VTSAVLRAVGVLFAVLAASAAGAAELVPHRALYKMTLVSARGGSGVETVQGEMIADWSESCDGWTLDQRSVFDVGYSSEQNVRIISNIATWESLDGLQYRFNVTNKTNDEVTERTEGHARLAAAKAGGKAEFDQPNPKTSELPAGTIFPTEHTRVLLRDIGGAPMILSHVVFDGLTDEGPLQVSTVIGAEVAPDPSPAMAFLKGLRSWPVQMAFFQAGSGAVEPEQEIGMRLFDNGVGDAMVLDFGDFKVRANLVRLELEKRPSCGR
jgi:hypothetical protein